MFFRCVFFQPFDKPADLRWIEMATEPGAFFFEVKFSRNGNGVRAEVVEVPRDERKLLALFKIVTGSFVVPPCLFIGTRLNALLLCESAVGKVLRSRGLFIHSHCVN